MSLDTVWSFDDLTSRAISSQLVSQIDERLRHERDLYRGLVALHSSNDPEGALQRILSLLVEVTTAGRGYLEVHGATSQGPRWSLSHGCTSEEAESIRNVTSRGIVAAALAAGKSLHVPYAALDERFSALPSVREQRLEAVLCVPLGGMGLGVVYLEGRRGAGPFVEADVSLVEEVAESLGPSLERAARAATSHADPTRPYRDRLRLDGIVGQSPAMARVFEQFEPYAPLDVTLLITGDSGTGKTQLARTIHDNSQRRNGPFIELNCAAIPEGLIESELFGSMPGAFPGARKTPGKVEAAEGGTLFLDEIVEIPYAAQGKLLQLLQSRQYYALASTKLATANVRLIAATNVDLPAMIIARRFREDLYYRLNVISLRMPSLAERREDIPLLVDALLARCSQEHRLPALPASDRFRMAMEAGDWNGNIRQLRNQVEAALIRAVAERATQVESSHLPDPNGVAERAPTFHEATRKFQRDLLRRELEGGGWNVSAAAERLDITRSHVYNLINQFGIVRR